MTQGTPVVGTRGLATSTSGATVEPNVWQLIVEERARLDVEDISRRDLELAAQCYLLANDNRPALPPEKWPPSLTWRPGERLVNLCRAGALLLAGSERDDPAAPRMYRAALAVAEGLSKRLASRLIPTPREDHR